MNERMRAMVIKAYTEDAQAQYPEWQMNDMADMLLQDLESFLERFAQDVAKECVANLTSVAANLQAVPDGHEAVFPEFVEGMVHGLDEGCHAIKQQFGIEE